MKPITTPKITLVAVLRFIFGLSLVVLITAYVLFQARNFILGPSITLTSELSPIQTKQVIEVRGIANNITVIWLNGREIYTDENGVFKEDLMLEDGYTILTLRARDRFGREAVLERRMVLQNSEMESSE